MIGNLIGTLAFCFFLLVGACDLMGGLLVMNPRQANEAYGIVLLLAGIGLILGSIWVVLVGMGKASGGLPAAWLVQASALVNVVAPILAAQSNRPWARDDFYWLWAAFGVPTYFLALRWTRQPRYQRPFRPEE